MTSEEWSGPSSDQTITKHELEECKTGERNRPAAGGVCSWSVVAAEQLGPVGEPVEENGYAALSPGWPDDPETVEEAKAHPQVFAGKSIGQVADHFETIIRGLDRKPAVIGHSFWGLLTQILAGRALAAVSVAMSDGLGAANPLSPESSRFHGNACRQPTDRASHDQPMSMRRTTTAAKRIRPSTVTHSCGSRGCMVA